MTQDTPKKSLLGRLIRLLLILIVIVIAFVALAPTLFSGFIKGKIVDSMEESVDGRVVMEDFSFGWFSGTKIGGFTLTRPGESEPALSIGSLSTAPSLSDVFSGRLIVEDIVAEDVTIRVKRTEDGIDWQDIAKKRKSATEKPQGDLGELPQFLVQAELRNLRFIYGDPQLDRPLDFTGMNMKLVAERGKDVTVKLSGPYGLTADIACQVFDDKRLRKSDAMTASGTINVANLDLSDLAPSLTQFLSSLAGELSTSQKFTYGPNGVVKVEGSTTWQNLVAKTGVAGLSAKSASCNSGFGMDSDGKKTLRAGLNLKGAEVVGLPKQIKPVPCGAGSLEVTLATNQVITLAGGSFEIPGGKLGLSGTYGLGETLGQGIKMDANTDLAIWSKFFDGLPDLRGAVRIMGVVPADITTSPTVVNVDIDALRLTGGPLEDKAYDCGKTNLTMKMTLPKSPEEPKKIDLDTKSNMWQIQMKSSLASSESAAFGALGQAGIKGSCDLEQFLAPFTDSRGQGRVNFDFLANLGKDELGIQDATIKGPATKGKFSARIGRTADEWRLLVNGEQFTYRRGDGIGLVLPKIQSRGEWNKTTGALSGQLSMRGVRTIGGNGPPVQGGDVQVAFDGKADQERGDYSINFSRLELAGFSGKGVVDYGKKGGLRLIRIDGVADYSELSARWLRLFDANATGSGKGPIAFELSPNGSDCKNASGSMEMSIPSLKSQGFSVSDLVVKGDMKEGRGKITQGSGKLNEGTVKLTGEIDLTGDETTFKTAAEMKRVKLVKEWQPAIARVIPLFAGIGVTAEGFVDLDLTADGEGNNWDAIKPRLNGIGSLGLAEGRIAGSPILDTLGLALGFNPNMSIKDINTGFQVKDGGIHQNGLVADLGTLKIRMGGTTYLDGRLDYDIGLKPVSQNPTNWQRYVALLSNDGYLPLKLRGSVDSPEPGLPDPAKLIEAGAKKLLGDGLGNLLGGNKDKSGKNKGIGGLLKELGGGNKKNSDGKKPQNPLDGLLKGLGGNKKKKNNDTQKNKNDPFGNLLNGLGGKKKKDGETKKKSNPLGGLLNGLGGGKKKDKNKKH